MWRVARVGAGGQRRPGRPGTVVSAADVRGGWGGRNAGYAADSGLVGVGATQFSATEIRSLATLLDGRARDERVRIVVTCGRAVFEQATQAGDVARLSAFGVQIVQDTCWCMLGEPIVPPDTRTIMTNSGKYAHYAPGLVGRGLRFGRLADCVPAPRPGAVPKAAPACLQPAAPRHSDSALPAPTPAVPRVGCLAA